MAAPPRRRARGGARRADGGGQAAGARGERPAPGMAGAPLLPLLLPLLACAWLGASQEAPRTPDWRLTLKTIRNGVHKIDVYLNAALDLLGGEDGLCHYKCSDGEGAAAGKEGNGRPGQAPWRCLEAPGRGRALALLSRGSERR